MGLSPHQTKAGQAREPDSRDEIRFLIHHDDLDSPARDTDLSSSGSDSESVNTAIFAARSPGFSKARAPAPLLNPGHRRFPSVDEDEQDDHHESEPGRPDTVQEKPVTWMSLPKRGQLAVLTFARLSEPLTQTSLQAYMFYQLKSFDPSLPNSTISRQAGILQGSFTAAQFLTAVWWGRLADAPWMGRKRVLLIGLMGTCISCLGFGFSRSFVSAAVFRTLGGALNSNVGVMRTMISEIIVEKKYVRLKFERFLR